MAFSDPGGPPPPEFSEETKEEPLELRKLGLDYRTLLENVQGMVEDRQGLFRQSLLYDTYICEPLDDPDLAARNHRIFDDRVAKLVGLHQQINAEGADLSQFTPEEIAALKDRFFFWLIFSKDDKLGSGIYNHDTPATYLGPLYQALQAQGCDPDGQLPKTGICRVDYAQLPEGGQHDAVQSGRSLASIVSGQGGNPSPVLVIDGLGREAIERWGFEMHPNLVERGLGAGKGLTLIRGYEHASWQEKASYGSVWRGRLAEYSGKSFSRNQLWPKTEAFEEAKFESVLRGVERALALVDAGREVALQISFDFGSDVIFAAINKQERKEGGRVYQSSFDAKGIVRSQTPEARGLDIFSFIQPDSADDITKESEGYKNEAQVFSRAEIVVVHAAEIESKFPEGNAEIQGIVHDGGKRVLRVFTSGKPVPPNFTLVSVESDGQVKVVEPTDGIEPRTGDAAVPLVAEVPEAKQEINSEQLREAIHDVLPQIGEKEWSAAHELHGRIGEELDPRELSGLCGTVCGELQDLLHERGIMAEEYVSDASDGNAHMYLVAQTDKGEMIIDPTIGMFLADYPGVFIGSRRELRTLVQSDEYELVQTRSAQNRKEAFRRTWGLRGKNMQTQSSDEDSHYKIVLSEEDERFFDQLGSQINLAGQAIHLQLGQERERVERIKQSGEIVEVDGTEYSLEQEMQLREVYYPLDGDRERLSRIHGYFDQRVERILRYWRRANDPQHDRAQEAEVLPAQLREAMRGALILHLIFSPGDDLGAGEVVHENAGVIDFLIGQALREQGINYLHDCGYVRLDLSEVDPEQIKQNYTENELVSEGVSVARIISQRHDSQFRKDNRPLPNGVIIDGYGKKAADLGFAMTFGIGDPCDILQVRLSQGQLEIDTKSYASPWVRGVKTHTGKSTLRQELEAPEFDRARFAQIAEAFRQAVAMAITSSLPVYVVAPHAWGKTTFYQAMAEQIGNTEEILFAQADQYGELRNLVSGEAFNPSKLPLDQRPRTVVVDEAAIEQDDSVIGQKARAQIKQLESSGINVIRSYPPRAPRPKDALVFDVKDIIIS